MMDRWIVHGFLSRSPQLFSVAFKQPRRKNLHLWTFMVKAKKHIDTAERGSAADPGRI